MNLTISYYINGHLRESKKVTTPCTIGRSLDAGLLLSHPALSRNHCTLYEQDGELYLKDNNSLNGTVFRGADIKEPARLLLGDMFSIGSELIFLVSDAGGEAAVPGELAERPTAVFTEEELRGEIGLSTVIQPARFPSPYEMRQE